MVSGVLSAENVSSYDLRLFGPITSAQIACETLVLALYIGLFVSIKNLKILIYTRYIQLDTSMFTFFL